MNTKSLTPYLIAFVYLVVMISPRLVLANSGPEVATFSDLNVMFARILGMIMPLATLVVFVMIMWGGYQYMTAMGNPQKIGQAWGTITWAIIGLLFLIGGWLVLVFLTAFTGVDVTKFEIPDDGGI